MGLTIRARHPKRSNLVWLLVNLSPGPSRAIFLQPCSKEVHLQKLLHNVINFLWKIQNLRRICDALMKIVHGRTRKPYLRGSCIKQIEQVLAKLPEMWRSSHFLRAAST